MQRTLAVVVFAAALVALSFSAVLDRHGERTTAELLAKGTVVFAVTRAAMAGLSVVEEIEISFAVVAGRPFKILRPVIDLLDRFSGVLFFSLASLGMLKILTWLFGTGAFGILYASIVAAFLVLYFTMPPRERLMEYWPWRLFLMASVVRFAFVLIVGMNFLVTTVFLGERQDAAIAELEQRAEIVETVSGEIGTLSEPSGARGAVPDAAPPDAAPPDAAEQGFFSRWGERLNPTRMLEDMRTKADAVVDSVIDVTVLFLLQAVIIPLIFLWTIIGLLRRLAP